MPCRLSLGYAMKVLAMYLVRRGKEDGPDKPTKCRVVFEPWSIEGVSQVASNLGRNW